MTNEVEMFCANCARPFMLDAELYALCMSKTNSGGTPQWFCPKCQEDDYLPLFKLIK